MVFLMLIPIRAARISVRARLWGELVWFKHAASVLPAFM